VSSSPPNPTFFLTTIMLSSAAPGAKKQVDLSEAKMIEYF